MQRGALCPDITQRGNRNGSPFTLPPPCGGTVAFMFRASFLLVGNTCPVQRGGLCPDITQWGNRHGSPFTLPPPCGGTIAFMFRASFLLAWGTPAPCSGASCALILRKGGTAMVPPSHFPLLAEGRLLLCFGRLFCWLGGNGINRSNPGGFSLAAHIFAH